MAAFFRARVRRRAPVGGVWARPHGCQPNPFGSTPFLWDRHDRLDGMGWDGNAPTGAVSASSSSSSSSSPSPLVPLPQRERAQQTHTNPAKTLWEWMDRMGGEPVKPSSAPLSPGHSEAVAADHARRKCDGPQKRPARRCRVQPTSPAGRWCGSCPTLRALAIDAAMAVRPSNGRARPRLDLALANDSSGGERERQATFPVEPVEPVEPVRPPTGHALSATRRRFLSSPSPCHGRVIDGARARARGQALKLGGLGLEVCTYLT